MNTNYLQNFFMYKTSGYLLLSPLIFVGMSTELISIILVGILVFIDFITGIAVSYYKHKKSPNKEAAYFIESNRLRDTLIKVCWYGAFTVTIFGVFIAIGVPTITIPLIATNSSPVTLALTICSLVEGFSILENSKKLGFDFIAIVKKITTDIISFIKFIIKIYKKV